VIFTVAYNEIAFIMLFAAGNAGEVCAVLCLDKKKVASTDWKSPSNAAWEQQFKIDLDKVWKIPT